MPRERSTSDKDRKRYSGTDIDNTKDQKVKFELYEILEDSEVAGIKDKDEVFYFRR